MTYEYDLANNVTRMVDGRGIATMLTYDEFECPLTRSYPNTRFAGKNENITYTYDTCAFGLGRLCQRSDESGSYQYRYDAFGNVVFKRFTEAAGTAYEQHFVYDEGGRLARPTWPSGRVVSCTRDVLRRLSDVSTTVNDTATAAVSNLRYRADNQLTQCVFGNGLADTRSYGLQGRLLTQRLGTAFVGYDERQYSYDLNGNIVSVQRTVEDRAGPAHQRGDRRGHHAPPRLRPQPQPLVG